MLTTIRVDQPFPFIRATLPLDGSEVWRPMACPFVLRDAHGATLETQWQRVAGTAESPTRLRVAELIAAAPAGALPGAVYTLERAPRPRPQTNAQPGPWARRLADVGGLRLRVDGEAVACNVLSRYRSGPCIVTLHIACSRAFGWLSLFHGLDVAWLDLVVHNAAPASSPWFFHELALEAAVPPVGLTSIWDESTFAPGMGGAQLLVAARSDGRRHGLEQRGWRIFQGALHDHAPESVALARQLADGAGWGVADSWTRVDAYQPHALRLPRLGYRMNELRTNRRAEWNKIRAALASGSPHGLGVTTGGRLDWRHPWGPPYGGVTGGAMRHQWSGVETAISGEAAGLLELRARLRMIADRSPVAITKPSGQPAILEDWITPSGPRGGWRMSAADGTFHHVGAFAWPSPGAPPADVCSEYAALGSYSPIDFQHHDRATKPAESLVYLANDPIARWWVHMSAEIWRMAQYTDSRQRASWTAATSDGGRGCGLGRADAHGWQNAAAAYAFGGAMHRARWRDWLARFAETLVAAQMPNGLYQRSWTNKQAKVAPFGNGSRASWAIAKGTEEALLASALFAVARATDLAPALRDAALESVDQWTIVGLWQFLAGSGSAPGGFTDFVSTAPVTWGVDSHGYPVATLGAPLSPGDPTIVRLNADRTEIAGPLGCAMLARLLTGREIAPEQSLALRRWAANAIDPLAWMRAQTLYKLELDDCAPAHAALEFQP